MSKGKYRKEQNCLNCGSNVELHYCSNCGQPNLELDENFWAFISHSVAHYFHFDNKFFQTLKPLITMPGKVTLDYLAGKRARYISPVSMYIFVSIVYFLVVYTTDHGNKPKEGKFVLKRRIEIQNKLKDTATTPKQLAALFYHDDLKGDTKEIRKLYDLAAFKWLDFKSQAKVIQYLDQQYAVGKSATLESTLNKMKSAHVEKNDSTYTAYLARQQKLAVAERDNWFIRMLARRSIGIGQNSERIQEMLEHNRPKQYFLFMPLMALFVMINFRRNHFKYLDHLIFTIHGMTAFFIVLIIVQPLKRSFLEHFDVLSTIAEIGVIIWICWYLFKSLKVFYQRKTSTTIWRMLWISILYFFSLKLAEMIMINIIFYVAT